MHYMVRILSQGTSRKEAYENAVSYADSLVEQGDFDYHYGEHSKTYELTSAVGKRAVEGALAANRRAFDDAIQVARLMLERYTDEQIYTDNYPDDGRDYYASRWQFSQVGDGHCYLYADLSGDQGIWSGKVSNDCEYQLAIAERDNVYVTPIGFHN